MNREEEKKDAKEIHEGKEIKPWKCGNGHVLGQVRRNGAGIRQLLLYREAVDYEAFESAEVDVMAVVEGYVTEVTCSVCGSVRTWVPGKEAIDRLVAGGS